jgi:hypothetical protein
LMMMMMMVVMVVMMMMMVMRTMGVVIMRMRMRVMMMVMMMMMVIMKQGSCLAGGAISPIKNLDWNRLGPFLRCVGLCVSAARRRSRGEPIYWCLPVL